MGQSEQRNNSCDMVGLLGIIIQVSLGVLSFSVLILKRHWQNPRRSWNIWLLDTSKQLVSQLLAHFINLTISIALTYSDRSSDQCLWYLATNILDNTLGVILCLSLLIFVEKRLIRNGKTQYVSGNYYNVHRVTVTIEIMANPIQKQQIEGKSQFKDEQKQNQPSNNQNNQCNQLVQEKQSELDGQKYHSQSENCETTETEQRLSINYKAWIIQLLIWITIVVLGKAFLFGIELGFQDPLKNFIYLSMGWIQDYQILELLMAIVLVPVLMNGLAFWVQDNFLKKNDTSKEEDALVVHEQSGNKDDHAYEIM